MAGAVKINIRERGTVGDLMGDRELIGLLEGAAVMGAILPG